MSATDQERTVPCQLVASPGAGLVGKWRRDSDLPLPVRMNKARRIVGDRLRAKVYLHGATAAMEARVVGRPRIVNQGTLVMGRRCVLRSIVAPIEIYLAPEATLTIGDDVHINSGVTLSAHESVRIGDRVEIAPHVTIHDNAYHDLYDRKLIPRSLPVVIEDDVWLTTRCTILPGVRIGRGAVVAANSVVHRDVEPFTVVSGVPARPIFSLDPAKFVAGTP
jgi:acetyltransferase-like isoleucine patch superfamily enzyme